MSVSYHQDSETRIAEIVVDGRVTRADFDRVAPQLKAFIDRHGNVKLVEIVRQLDGFEVSALWPGIKFDVANLRHISHCAVVSDIGWLSPLSKAANALMTTKLRTFALDEIDAARAWIDTV